MAPTGRQAVAVAKLDVRHQAGELPLHQRCRDALLLQRLVKEVRLEHELRWPAERVDELDRLVERVQEVGVEAHLRLQHHPVASSGGVLDELLDRRPEPGPALLPGGGGPQRSPGAPNRGIDAKVGGEVENRLEALHRPAADLLVRVDQVQAVLGAHLAGADRGADQPGVTHLSLQLRPVDPGRVLDLELDPLVANLRDPGEDAVQVAHPAQRHAPDFGGGRHIGQLHSPSTSFTFSTARDGLDSTGTGRFDGSRGATRAIDACARITRSLRSASLATSSTRMASWRSAWPLLNASQASWRSTASISTGLPSRWLARASISRCIRSPLGFVASTPSRCPARTACSTMTASIASTGTSDCACTCST